MDDANVPVSFIYVWTRMQYILRISSHSSPFHILASCKRAIPHMWLPESCFFLGITLILLQERHLVGLGKLLRLIKSDRLDAEGQYLADLTWMHGIHGMCQITSFVRLFIYTVLCQAHVADLSNLRYR